jgi:hypothetical protein
LKIFLLFFTPRCGASNANELLALKKIETYITNTTHLIDEAEAMQTNAERYKFRYYALRQDLTDNLKIFLLFFTPRCGVKNFICYLWSL